MKDSTSCSSLPPSAAESRSRRSNVPAFVPDSIAAPPVTLSDRVTTGATTDPGPVCPCHSTSLLLILSSSAQSRCTSPGYLICHLADLSSVWHQDLLSLFLGSGWNECHWCPASCGCWLLLRCLDQWWFNIIPFFNPREIIVHLVNFHLSVHCVRCIYWCSVFLFYFHYPGNITSQMLPKYYSRCFNSTWCPRVQSSCLRDAALKTKNSLTFPKWGGGGKVGQLWGSLHNFFNKKKVKNGPK